MKLKRLIDSMLAKLRRSGNDNLISKEEFERIVTLSAKVFLFQKNTKEEIKAIKDKEVNCMWCAHNIGTKLVEDSNYHENKNKIFGNCSYNESYFPYNAKECNKFEKICY